MFKFRLNLNPIIICEGECGEVAYIQELNKYFAQNEISISLNAKPVGTGYYTEVIKKYRHEKKNNKKHDFYIWVDKDIYKRNARKSGDKYLSKTREIPDFYFNFFNFEDFLIMHLEKEEVLKYQKLCDVEGHFDNPMESERYMDLIKNNVFKNYSKGCFPEEFIINRKSIERLFKNNKDSGIKFRSDFADLIEKLILDASAATV